MRDLLNAAEMKAVDQRSIEEYGIPSLVLMERAALEVVNGPESFWNRGFRGMRPWSMVWEGSGF